MEKSENISLSRLVIMSPFRSSIRELSELLDHRAIALPKNLLGPDRPYPNPNPDPARIRTTLPVFLTYLTITLVTLKTSYASTSLGSRAERTRRSITAMPYCSLLALSRKERPFAE